MSPCSFWARRRQSDFFGFAPFLDQLRDVCLHVFSNACVVGPSVDVDSAFLPWLSFFYFVQERCYHVTADVLRVEYYALHDMSRY